MRRDGLLDIRQSKVTFLQDAPAGSDLACHQQRGSKEYKVNETIQTFDVAAILRRMPHLDLARETAGAAADAFPMLAPFGTSGLSGPGPVSWADDPRGELGERG